MTRSDKTSRGRFRSIDMKDLIKRSADSVWDSEESTLTYVYPLPRDEDFLKRGAHLCQGIPKSQLYKVGSSFWAAKSPDSHIGPFLWATDFLVPDGTKVLSAQEGTIIEIQEHSSSWGDGPEFRDLLNYLTIQHKGGEYSQYCHLAPFSVSELGLSVGDSVKQGQPIGAVGKTGWTDRDHLHFIVFRDDNSSKNPHGFKSLKIRFSNQSWGAQ